MTYYRRDDTYTQEPLVVTTLFGALALLTCVLRAHVLTVRCEKCTAQDWLIFAATACQPTPLTQTVEAAVQAMLLTKITVLYTCLSGNPVGM